MTEASHDPVVGTLVAGRYRVIKRLGEGGMGQVYLAEHEIIEKRVALKILRPEYSRKEDIVTRFQQEAISASRIKHPNVLDVFDFGRLDTGEAFLAMEFLEGHDLSDELAKVGVVEPHRGLHIALQICRALAAAHTRGVVHRDMKPDNVFLQRTGDGDEMVKIVDFGIAQLRTTEEAAKSQPTRRRLTKTGMIFGTPEYMAPEQAIGRPADQRVDIYAVGVILYELFTGAVPFTGDSFMAVLTATLNEPPPPMAQMNPQLRISAELQAVILRALAKNPADRYGSMAELSNALLSTPEGAAFGRPTQASGEVRLSSIPAPGAGIPTAAQFGQLPANPAPTEASLSGAPAGSTAAFGTPGAATSHKPTPIGGQSATVAPVQAPSVGLVLGSAAMGLAVLATGGYLVFTRVLGGGAPGSTDTAKAASLTPEPPAQMAAGAPAPTAPVAPSAVPAATVAPAPAPAEVHLHVMTEPAGATVAKGGFQVCDATPCDVTVPRNEGVELTASKGTLRGSSKILPQKDQTVTIALAAPAVARPKPKTDTGPAMCETMTPEGLKILRRCDSLP